MYKQAAMLKLRFETPKGLLTAEQLFDLSMTDLSTTIKKVNALLKKEQATDNELSFLEGVDTSETQNSLRFRILKDVYLTKKEARDQAALDYEKKQRNQRIAEIIARKKEEALESKSIEELEKMLQE